MVTNGPQPRPTDPTAGQTLSQPYGQQTTQPTGLAPTGTTPMQQPKKRVRVPGKVIVGAIVLAIAIWFIAVNSQDVHVKLWVHTVSAPMWLVLVVTLAVGMLLGLLAARRRRRKKAANQSA